MMPLWILLLASLGSAPVDAVAPRADRPAAGGQESDREAEAARRHFDAAQRAFQEGRLEEAIARFEAAYRAKPHGALFFNLGKCAERLGDLSRARNSYREYLRQVPDASDRDLVEAAIEALERSLKERGAQSLSVRSAPPGARVTLDGQLHGTAPLDLLVAPGAHQLELVLDGHEPRVQPVSVPVEGPLEVELTLEPALPRSAQRGRFGPRQWAYVVAGAAGGALAVGGGFGLAANQTRTELFARPHPSAEVQRLHDAALGQAAGANVSYGLAVAAGVTALILYFVGAPDDAASGASK